MNTHLGSASRFDLFVKYSVAMTDALCFTSFDKIKSEVAQRTRRALLQQHSSGSSSLVYNTVENDESASHSATDPQPRFHNELNSFDISKVSEIRHVEPEDSSGLNKLSQSKSLKSDNGLPNREQIPLHERVPERFKHTPKSFSTQPLESKKAAPISQRLLQMMPSKARSVVLYANDGQYNKAGVRVLLPETMDLLLDVAVQKLDLPAAARIV